MTERQDLPKDVTSELRSYVRSEIERKRDVLSRSQPQAPEFTDEHATDAAMQAFKDHIHDPRTIERACKSYFGASGTASWDGFSEMTKDVWRDVMLQTLKSVLE